MQFNYHMHMYLYVYTYNAIVLQNQNEADDFNLEVDSDDSHAAIPDSRNKSFALIIHGTQPAKPKAKKAKKKEGVTARSVSLVG